LPDDPSAARHGTGRGAREAQAQRTTALPDRAAISTTEGDEARMQAAMAREEPAEAHLSVCLAGIEAEQAEALPQQKTARAPFDGLITERLLSPGEYRDGQTRIATIVRLDVLRVEAFAPIAHVPHLTVGQTVTIRPRPRSAAPARPGSPSSTGCSAPPRAPSASAWPCPTPPSPCRRGCGARWSFRRGGEGCRVSPRERRRAPARRVCRTAASPAGAAQRRCGTGIADKPVSGDDRPPPPALRADAAARA
jgi:hypothetical protein